MRTPLFDLEGRRALVTGSSQGIGYALARGLARHGARIVLNGRKGEGRGGGAGFALKALMRRRAIRRHRCESCRRRCCRDRRRGGRYRHLDQQCGHAVPHPAGGFSARQVGPDAAHQHLQHLFCRTGCRAVHDRARRGQDCQYRLCAERTGAPGHSAIHGDQGRGAQPDARHVDRLGQAWASGQRAGAGLLQNAAQPSAGR